MNKKKQTSYDICSNAALCVERFGGINNYIHWDEYLNVCQYSIKRYHKWDGSWLRTCPYVKELGMPAYVRRSFFNGCFLITVLMSFERSRIGSGLREDV